MKDEGAEDGSLQVAMTPRIWGAGLAGATEVNAPPRLPTTFI
jgi:hypothetical protein